MKLPSPTFDDIWLPRTQYHHLEMWLHEDALRRSLEKSEAHPNESQEPCIPTDLSQYIRETNHEVCEGQIRLLRANIVPNANRPVYVLVLKVWDEYDQTYLVTPFSSYYSPATPEEILITSQIELRNAPTRVLSLWNTHTIAYPEIIESWLVTTLSTQELQKIWEVFSCNAIGKPLPDEWTDKIGAPILSVADPRNLYLEEELNHFIWIDSQCKLWLDTIAELNEIVSGERQIPDIAFAQLRNAANQSMPMAAKGLQKSTPVIVVKDSYKDFIQSITEGRFVINSTNTTYAHINQFARIPKSSGENEDQIFAQWLIPNGFPDIGNSHFLLLDLDSGTVLAKGRFNAKGTHGNVNEGNYDKIHRAKSKLCIVTWQN